MMRWMLVVAALACGRQAVAAECSEAAIQQDAARFSRQLAPLAPGLSAGVLNLATRAYALARCHGKLQRDLMTVIDYSLPSDVRRMWVLDVAQTKLLFHERVAHGRGSGDRWATAFSNRDGSHQSSLGAFVTGPTYIGKHGVSLLLEGLESGVNDAARSREVVIHGAPYMTDDFIAKWGRAGRSWGCPAVAPEIAPSLIQTVKGGTFLWTYYPDERWLQHSRYLAPG